MCVVLDGVVGMFQILWTSFLRVPSAKFNTGDIEGYEIRGCTSDNRVHVSRRNQCGSCKTLVEKLIDNLVGNFGACI